MRIEHLMYLQEIVRKKSFSNAAEALYISQQSLSEAVAKIEGQFHLKIFLRSRKGAQLTPRGEAFMADVDRLIAVYREMEDRYGLQVRTEEKKQPMTICISHMVADVAFGEIMQAFQDKYPNIVLSIAEERMPEQVLQQVAEQKAQLGITSLPGALYKHVTMANVNIVDIYMDYLCLLVNKSHRFVGRTSLLPEECIKEPLVLDSEGRIKHNVLEYSCPNLVGDKALHIVMETTTGEAYLRLVKQGLAVGFITKMQYNLLNDPDLVAIPLKDVDPLRFVIITPQAGDNLEAAQGFMKIFVENIVKK